MSNFSLIRLLSPALFLCLLGGLLTNTQAQNQPKPGRAEKRALKEANDVYDKLQKGEDFAALARTYSDDIGSAKNGGNLGSAKKGMMVPEFEAKVLTLKPGEISRPVHSDFGYHIIQLLQWKGDEFESRHILIRGE
jgi:hypothetical protein